MLLSSFDLHLVINNEIRVVSPSIRYELVEYMYYTVETMRWERAKNPTEYLLLSFPFPFHTGCRFGPCTFGLRGLDKTIASDIIVLHAFIFRFVWNIFVHLPSISVIKFAKERESKGHTSNASSRSGAGPADAIFLGAFPRSMALWNATG